MGEDPNLDVVLPVAVGVPPSAGRVFLDNADGPYGPLSRPIPLSKAQALALAARLVLAAARVRPQTAQPRVPPPLEPTAPPAPRRFILVQPDR